MTDLHARGFALAQISLSSTQCDHIASAIPSVSAGRGGVRGLVSHPTVLQILHHKQLGDYLWSVVGRELVAVKATLFDKTVASNWRAQWHQDRVIAIRERMDVPGYGPWTVKAGVPHVEPPASVLEQMLALRVYLDESGPENGPLRVLPGSHHLGKLDDDEIQRLAEAETPAEVHARKGEFLLMRPLLVHSSSPSIAPDHRRVLHIELAPAEAISPLQWQTAVQLRRAA
ncbi:MAG TPA: phytanoyl-CoA dioxygenase family protein [Thermoanaerobaculia bacterium]|nr:phytanoyl-CoA dioxygenase family protein [Thermoanaerobaculia bacterium]